MPTDASLFGPVTLAIVVLGGVGVFARSTLQRGAYDLEIDGYGDALGTVVGGQLGLGVGVGVLYAVTGATPATVGLGSDAVSPRLAGIGVLVAAGLALLVMGIARRAVAQAGMRPRAAVYAVLAPRSAGESVASSLAVAFAAVVQTTVYVGGVVLAAAGATSLPGAALVPVAAVSAALLSWPYGPGQAIVTAVAIGFLGVTAVATGSLLVPLVGYTVFSVASVLTAGHREDGPDRETVTS